MSGCTRSSARRGFSVVELLVVIVIIGIVLSILFPAISGARTSARSAGSLSMLNGLSSATTQFNVDKRVMPGYFSATDMADPANGDLSGPGRGFSAMQNILLDLTNVLADSAAVANGSTIVNVGPRANNLARVDLRLLGSGTAAVGPNTGYFKPDGAYMVAQETTERQPGSEIAHRLMPTVVDAFGTPVLAWVQNSGPTSVFSRVNSNDPEQAQFYWGANATYLHATGLGKLGRNQTWDGTARWDRPGSMIGAGLSAAQIAFSLEGILGNPAFPVKQLSASDRPRPSAAKAPVMYHSAGANGLFVGSNERGGATARGAAPTNQVKYSAVDDVMRQGEYDDVIVRAGN